MNPLERLAQAAPERTLVDILRLTAARHGDQPAVDDGHVLLTYAELLSEADGLADRLADAGVGRGGRVGVRMASGSADLYVGIAAVLISGAAYVPVDADDPPARAELVFGTADVDAVLLDDAVVQRRTRPGAVVQTPGADRPNPPAPDDDAWVIFTSGSTGAPKGVAVTHRSAAAFVDAEARLFVQDEPIGPADRVLAGLSVAFDASCEEMWLAWRHGACLVPAPRALVRSGMDLAPWLVDRAVTVVSTVPTLAALWPDGALDDVRLLIFGGEVCPAELVDRVVDDHREVWNTYGPTEATVVACAARLGRDEQVRIGLPLDGWDLAVVDRDHQRVPEGEVGELLIGGVGLARYLDPTLTAQRFAPAPSLGWDRAYRSGDLVRADAEGLVFVGRADDQVKVGGRRIELGEVDAALLRLDGVAAAAAAVRTTEAGNKVLIGYLTVRTPDQLDRPAALRRLRSTLPAALVPLLAVVDDIPTRTSGKVDRDALPWPLNSVETDTGPTSLTGTAGWIGQLWVKVLGTTASGEEADFFADGGGSLAAAQLVSALRERYPQVTVADVYENPRLGRLADRVEELRPADDVAEAHDVRPVPRRAQLIQTLVTLALAAANGARYLTWVAAAGNVMTALDGPSWLPRTSWWWVLGGFVLLVTPWGRMAVTVLAARCLLRDLRPGHYPRGGAVHLRLWAVEAVADTMGATNLAGAPWVTAYARALGARVGTGVDLQAVPPVTGLLTLGDRSSIEPEVDLSGHWLAGDTLHVGRVRVEADASVGSRSVLLPGARVGQGAEVAAGTSVSGSVPPGERWVGSPATRAGVAHRDWPRRRPGRGARWVPVYAATATGLAGLPVVAAVAGLAVLWPAVRATPDAGQALLAAVRWIVPGTVVALVTYALLTALITRLVGLGLTEGHHAVRSRVGWQVWTTERLMDEARTYLYPLYASLFTATWLRILGAKIGRGVEASTVLMLPGMTTVGDDAFLADDTLVGSYELAGGWMRIERTKIGKRAFLGNSGMTGPGRVMRKDSLVAVLSAAPERAKPGTSWLGSPPTQLQRRARTVGGSRTFRPPRSVRVRRALVEVCRIGPAALSGLLGFAVAVGLAELIARSGPGTALLAAGPVLVGAGLVGAGLTTVAKWTLVGRHRPMEQPLWSSFVWRNELVDMFVELLAVPWFVRSTLATPPFVCWLRSLGAALGRGVWCQTYWLPEPDLVRIQAAASIDRGCVLQTHLFHDRIMSMDTVVVGEGATLGAHSVVLPAAVLGAAAVVGPASLVLRGDEVPAGSRWTGNPIVPWQ